MRPAELLQRVLRPPRTTRPTREGWWFLLATLGLGVAALNTGVNLLYLLVSMLLGLVVASGILCEQSMRGLRLFPVIPREIFAGQPALLGLRLRNRKRRLASHSLVLEVSRPAVAESRGLYVPRLEPGQEQLITFEERFPRRGRHRLPGLRIVTRFPFGLFLKASREVPGEKVLVFPRIRPLAPPELRALGSGGSEPAPRVGRGAEFYGLRDYRWGDDPRRIHWKSSAKTATLMVREGQADSPVAVRLLLESPRGPIESERLEGAISFAASVAAHLIRAGASVELAGAGLGVPPGSGAAHLRRILEALALFDPEASESSPRNREARISMRPPARVIRIPLDGGSPG